MIPRVLDAMKRPGDVADVASAVWNEPLSQTVEERILRRLRELNASGEVQDSALALFVEHRLYRTIYGTPARPYLQETAAWMVQQGRPQFDTCLGYARKALEERGGGAPAWLLGQGEP